MMTREASRADGGGVVEQLAAWVLAARAHDLSQAAILQAKLLLLDTIGCGFAALSEQSARALLEVVETAGGAPQCTVIGQARRTSAPNATLANGALVRILDFNDYVNDRGGDLGGHPSDNIPVALAAGELSGASGREVIAAVVLGYEIFGRCKELMEHDSAWDGVTVSGLAAPAMAGRLMGLDHGRLAHAIALSAARAATSTAVRFGDISAAKSIANALVAQNGVQAALLAEHGITGPLDLFENPRGMREVFCKGDAATALTAPLPAESYIMAANVKAFPCLATGQSVVAAGIEMHGRLRGAVDRLTGLTLIIPDTPGLRRQKDDPGRIKPASREAADHSFNFLAAVSLIDGEFGLAQFDGDRWNDPKVCALMARLEIINDTSWNRRAPDSYPCSLAVRIEDGREEVVEIPYPPGFSRGRLEAETVMKKFNTITAPHLVQRMRDRIIEAVMALDESASCAELMAAVATESAVGSGRSRSLSGTRSG
jgi:2-methylcitrate dehydratase